MTAVARPRGAKARAAAVVELLRELYPDVQCALDHTNAYELLAATILSAQCTDERVNMVTPTLFAKYPTPADLARRRPGRGRDAHPVDRASSASKTKSLIGMAQAVDERFGGEVPVALDDLVTLARRRAQDRQRRALGVVPRARAAGRHARHAALGAA